MMSGAFVNPSLGTATELGVSVFEDTCPIELRSGASEEEIETVIRAAYRQVLGNAYVMTSERLVVPESKLKRGEISVREFVRQVALSELYRSRFFEDCPPYRSIELNFKHLLGRAPESYEEMRAHSQVLDEGGFEAEINSYLDSDEYLTAFGENIVPSYRGYKTQTGRKMIGFPYFFQLVRGASSSDKDTANHNRSRLNRLAIANTPTTIFPPSSKGSGLTRVESILAEVLKPQPGGRASYSQSRAKTEDYLALQRQCREQEAAIAKLQQQIAELRPFANVAAAQFSQWQAYSTGTSVSVPATGENIETASYSELERRSREQAKAIAALEQNIAELRPLAAIAEAKLNKWRSRTFSR